jgi:hypothetical protein
MLTDFITGPIPITAFTKKRKPMLLMWYDADKKTTQADKIKAAVAAYRRKFGQPATTVYVNMGQYDEALEIDGLDIVGKRNVLPHHLQVGRTIDNQ